MKKIGWNRIVSYLCNPYCELSGFEENECRNGNCVCLQCRSESVVEVEERYIKRTIGQSCGEKEIQQRIVDSSRESNNVTF